MPGIFPKHIVVILLLLVGGLYAVKWERQSTSREYVSVLADLLDDRLHPVDCDFSGRSSRLCKMLVTLQEASEAGLHQDAVVRAAAEKLSMPDSYTDLLVESLMQNTKTALGMGLLSEEDRPNLAGGALPSISKGAYAGGKVDFEFAVPIEAAPELEEHFANLALRPVLLTREIGLPVDDKCYRTASNFYNAQLISRNSYVRVGARYDEHLRR